MEPLVGKAFRPRSWFCVRRAAAIRNGELIGSWLHGVAHRVAVRAKPNRPAGIGTSPPEWNWTRSTRRYLPKPRGSNCATIDAELEDCRLRCACR